MATVTFRGPAALKPILVSMIEREGGAVESDEDLSRRSVQAITDMEMRSEPSKTTTWADGIKGRGLDSTNPRHYLGME